VFLLLKYEREIFQGGLGHDGFGGGWLPSLFFDFQVNVVSSF